MLTTQVALLVLLLLLSGFFSATEAAFLSLHRVHLRRLELDSRRSSRHILEVLSAANCLLTSILVGNPSANVAIPVVATGLVTRWLDAGGVDVAIVVTTGEVLLVGEITHNT